MTVKVKNALGVDEIRRFDVSRCLENYDIWWFSEHPKDINGNVVKGLVSTEITDLEQQVAEEFTNMVDLENFDVFGEKVRKFSPVLKDDFDKFMQKVDEKKK